MNTEDKFGATMLFVGIALVGVGLAIWANPGAGLVWIGLWAIDFSMLISQNIRKNRAP